MTHTLTEVQMQRRVELFQAWAGGYSEGKELSTLGHAFFCKFIDQHHRDLCLSKQERAVADMFENLLDADIDQQIEDRLPELSATFGVPSELARAFLHGRALAHADNPKLSETLFDIEFVRVH